MPAVGAEVILVSGQEESEGRQQAAQRRYQTAQAADTAEKFQYVFPYYQIIHGCAAIRTFHNYLS
jgi:hypothetical protein